jgi:uncharacterized protein (UPF0333 family)
MNNQSKILFVVLVTTAVFIASALIAITTTTKAAFGIKKFTPIATSSNNAYITWWSNKTGNDEVMFRASNDNGATFGHKMNLSNTTGANSQDAEIAASGNNVYVTWWERNQTSDEPVLRVSSDNGGTFGPILKLASNGTIGGGG